MSESGQGPPWPAADGTAGLPPAPEIARVLRHLRFVPNSEVGSGKRAPYRLIVKLWSMATCIARRFVVVDPELGMLLIHDARELVHRVQRHLAIGVETRNSPVLPVRLKMDGIPGQQHIACLVQMNEQRLVASGVAGCRQDRQTAVAEQILVAIEEFSLVLGAERLLRRRHRGLPLVSLHDQGGVGERVDIADMIGMDMRRVVRDGLKWLPTR
jgi:hypothetical protein